MLPQNEYKAALYMRLSRDEAKKQESNSITNQRRILTEYATERDFTIVEEFIDDGVSGTSFDRPRFKDMMQAIESKLINTVIVKDLSRLGREYLETGNYMEKIFPRLNVRLIAIGDNYDSLLDDETSQDMSALINYFNEYHAKQTSRKTKAAKKALAKAGKFTGTKAPFGYRLDPADRHHLIIDEEAAEVVKQIFQWACDGSGYKAICRMLREAKLLNPSAYANERNPGTYKSEYWQQPHDWHATSIKTILHNEVYLGRLVSGKRQVRSFKCKDIIEVPREEQIIVENTHEAIVDERMWNLAHEKLLVRKRCDNHGAVQIFAGLVKCADCGYAMAYTQSEAKPRYQCSTYNVKGKAYCKSHHITYDELYSAVLHDIRRRAKAAAGMDEHVLQKLRSEASGQLRAAVVALEKEYVKCNARFDELDSIIAKLFEQNALGKLSAARYEKMLEQYETEQEELREHRAILNQELTQKRKANDENEQFLKLIAKYKDITKLNAPILNELVRRIEIGAIEKVDGVKHRKIRIEYRQYCYVEMFTQDQVFAGWTEEMLAELAELDRKALAELAEFEAQTA